MGFQSVTLLANTSMMTMTLSQCLDCFALVEAGSQARHEQWHKAIEGMRGPAGPQGPMGPMGMAGETGKPGGTLSHDELQMVVDELDRRDLRRELSEEQGGSGV